MWWHQANCHLSLVMCHLSLVMCHLSLVACHLSPRIEILQDYQVSPSMAASLMALPSLNRCQILMLGLQGVVDLWINCSAPFILLFAFMQAQCLSFCCLTMTKEPLAVQDLPRPWWQLWWLDDHSNQYLARNAVVYARICSILLEFFSWVLLLPARLRPRKGSTVGRDSWE